MSSSNMSKVLILPAPLPSSSFALGQLLTDPLSSDSISFKPIVKPAYNKHTTQSRYEDTILRDEEGRFISSLGKTDPSVGNVVVVNADESSLTSLTDASAAFEALRRDTEAQSFLRRSGLQRQPLYFVTGIQKLKNVSYRRTSAKDSSTAENTGHQTRLPMPERRDSAELEPEEDGATESVFAVELMKVACRAGAMEEPHSIEDIDYAWTYQTLEEPDMQLSIGFGKALQAKELRALAGIVIDEDFEAQGHYTHYFDDEGLSGFSSD